ncbi:MULTISPECIES: superoxide dismutase family protein [Aphanothece]|uniref:superoxide dismutase family protein n=1 Tax=Aphanothece TaxID=1121 RepID=UPI00398F0399
MELRQGVGHESPWNPALLAVLLACLLSLLLFLPLAAGADQELRVALRRIDAEGVHASLGSLSLRDSPEGLVILPDLQDLPPGEHGFHLHALGDCGPGDAEEGPVAGLSAGGHWDPDGSGHHLGPDGNGHRGDLSRLVVAADGSARLPVRAPRLRVGDLAGKALIVHAGGDTYSDTPPLGGGGARIACAVVPG